MIVKLLFTLFIFCIIVANNLNAEITSFTSTVPSFDKQDLEKYESTDFDSPIIKTTAFTKPNCLGNECVNKLLLGIGLHYDNEKDFNRSTSNHPKEIIESKLFFPYYEQRNTLDTSSLPQEDVSSLSQKIKSALSNKKSAIVLLDAHGIKKVSPFQEGGILIPEQSACKDYQKTLQKISIEIKNIPPSSPQYQEMLTSYQQTYQQYSQKLCHERILPYPEYETSLNGPTLIHFNSMDPVHQMGRQKVGEQYALFDAFTFVGSALYQHNYYKSNHNEYTQTHVYSASSNYQSELEKFNSCSFDVDKNNQIEFNEIYHKLKPIFFTEGLKKGSAQEKAFNWNTMGTRDRIKYKEDMAVLFSTSPGKYSDAYTSTFNSPGFSVVFNLSGCNVAAPELFDSTKKVLTDSQLFKQKAKKLIPTYEVSMKDEESFEKLLMYADDASEAEAKAKASVTAKPEADPIIGKTPPVKHITADKVKIKNEEVLASSTSLSQPPVKITADKTKKLFISSTVDKMPYQNAAEAISVIEGTKKKNGLYVIHADPNGRTYSIGYGHNLTPEEMTMYKEKYPNGVPSDVVDKILANDVKRFYDNVDNKVNPNLRLNENQKIALTSLAYSIGNGAFNRSGLLKLINSGASMEEIKNRWYAYNKITDKNGNKVSLKGLDNRRIKEWLLFLTPV